ncbi:MAG TPA: efflux RND transporter permease subunit, partial [Allocoleopsis sp.]
MAKVVSYLQQLKFDPKLTDSLIGKYLRNIRLVILVVILTLVTGIVSFLNLHRVLNPEIKIPIVMVSTVLPGAGPNDVESLLTIPIEDGVKNVDGVTKVSSVSQNSVSMVTLEFETGVDADKAKDDVQSAVQSITNLPKDVKSPTVNKLDFGKVPVWTFELSGKDPASLTRVARNLRDALKDLPTVDNVQVSGLDEQEIQVLIKPSAIATYGVNPLVLSQAVNTAVGAIPSGNITTEGSS